MPRALPLAVFVVHSFRVTKAAITPPRSRPALGARAGRYQIPRNHIPHSHIPRSLGGEGEAGVERSGSRAARGERGALRSCC